MVKVSFLGIGAQKSASTWLYGILGQFPEVFVSDPKELDFFSSFFDRGYEWYERHFAEGEGLQHRGEVSPSYLIDADTPARVRDYNKGMKILVCLRDPVERAFSNHLHEVRAGHVSGQNLVFETALTNNPLYLNQGLYSHHLDRWLEHFPREQIHVTFQEHVKADSLRESQRLAAFMELSLPAEIVQRRANESMGYKNELLGGALWRIGKAARQSGFGGAIEKIKQVPGIRQVREANQKDIRKEIAPMRPETAWELTDYFREDVRKLETVMGVSVPWTRFGQVAA